VELESVWEAEPAPRRRSTTSDDRTMAMLCHLLGIFTGFLGPLILWLMKREDSKYIDYHGKEALNFHINVFVWALIIGALTTVISIVTCGLGVILALPVWLALEVTVVVLCIIASQKANRGELYQYPLVIRVIAHEPSVQRAASRGSASRYSGSRGDYEDEDRGRDYDTRPQSQGGVPAWVWIGMAVAALLLLGGCVIGVLIYFVTNSSPPTTSAKAAEARPEPAKRAPEQPNKAPAAPPQANRDDMDEALENLKSPNAHLRAQGASRLMGLNLEDVRRPEVAKALEPLLDDPDKAVHEAAARTLAVLATPENIPALEKLLEHKDKTMRVSAMHGLATTKERKAGTILAGSLRKPEDRAQARLWLITMGRVVEGDVAKYLTDGEAAVRKEAAEILQHVGTIRSVSALEKAAQDKDKAVAQAAKRAVALARLRR
jgi:uncharacterized Tic20 family protein